MRYIEEFFSVSFEKKDRIHENPIPYGRICRRCVEKTRYVGIARIQREIPREYKLEGITIVILPGNDKITPTKRKKIMAYAEALARERYARLLRGRVSVHVDPDIPAVLRDADLWMPSKCLLYSQVEIF